MTRFHWLSLGVVLAGGLAAAGPAAAQAVAVVEDVNSKSAGVEFMDYVDAGKVIKLAATDTLVLGYMKSCWRETITGGTVTVGPEQSTVADGRVRREKVGCDGGKMQLTQQQASKSGAMVFRAPPKATPAPGSPPQAQLTLYGLSPVVEVKGGGHLVIERIDQPGEKIEVNIADRQLMRGAFYDFAKADKALAAGGLYRASVGANEIVFKVDPFAAPGQAPVVSRLLRFVPAS
jgi:hypothetical protein